MASHLPEGTDSIIGESASNTDAANLGTFGAADAPYRHESAGPTPTSGTASEEPDDADSAPATGSTGGAIGYGTASTGTAGAGFAAPDAKPDDDDDAAGKDTAGEAAAAAGSTLDQAKAKLTDGATGLKGQATDKAREYALLGKDRATETLHNVSKMLDDAAAQVDEKVGGQYGDYARQAAERIKGFAAGIEEKDVDELIAQGTELVKKRTGIAIGAAAAIGFVLTRIVKAGLDPASGGEQA